MYKEMMRMAYAELSWVGKLLCFFKKSNGIGSSMRGEANYELYA